MIEPTRLERQTNVFADTPPAPKRRLGKIILLVLILDTALILLGCTWYFSTPPTRTKEVTIDIPEGSSVRQIAQLLKSEDVIRSPELFHAVVRYRGNDTSLPSGVFMFAPGRDLFFVIEQLVKQERGIARLRVTIPEGLTTKQIVNLLVAELPHIDGAQFTKLVDAPGAEIFPDTYFFYSTATSGEVFRTMSDNFLEKTATLHKESDLRSKKWHDIMVMASLIEEEAVEDVDRKMVSGVLWNRIKLGMRLQVDASFAYLLGKASSEITDDDLKMDSPFNTYRYAGLPPAPIAHPGISAIDAALHPTDSAFLFYLSDENGTMHYAKTFAEHKLNKERYLR